MGTTKDPSDYPWFRFYLSALRNPKLRRVSTDWRWTWVAVLGLARESKIPGVLVFENDVPATIDDIADLAAVKKREVFRAISYLKEQEMLAQEGNTFVIINWDQYQFSSDSSTPRVRAWRERQVKLATTLPETLQKRFCNVSGNVSGNVRVTGSEYRVQNTEDEVIEIDTSSVSELRNSKLITCALQAKRDTDDFDIFYKAYPRKKSPENARKAWKQNKPKRPPLEVLLKAIEPVRAKYAVDPEHVPYPSSWLRAGGFNDVPDCTPSLNGNAPPNEERMVLDSRIAELSDKIHIGEMKCSHLEPDNLMHTKLAALVAERDTLADRRAAL